MKLENVTETEYGYSKAVPYSYNDAISRVTELLQQQGFGILTEINVKEKIKEKLGIEDFEPYIILGACNPSLAYQAILRERELGLLLPCNVIVYERNGNVHVAIMHPIKVLGFTKNDSLQEVAEEADKLLRRVLAAL